jgi:hypothetical protein
VRAGATARPRRGGERASARHEARPLPSGALAQPGTVIELQDIGAREGAAARPIGQFAKLLARNADFDRWLAQPRSDRGADGTALQRPSVTNVERASRIQNPLQPRCHGRSRCHVSNAGATRPAIPNPRLSRRRAAVGNTREEVHRPSAAKPARRSRQGTSRTPAAAATGACDSASDLLPAPH